MKLLFGLGNPGLEYRYTRHNIAWQVLDMYDTNWQEKTKFKALVSEQVINGEKVIFAKPTTFYNHVGESYRALLDFYRLSPEETLVIHDELMLPFGTIRARIGGSDAGNNGIKSINQHGGQTSMRLRIGVGTDARTVLGDTNFVLAKFSKDEQASLEKDILPVCQDIIGQFNDDAFHVTSHRLA